jgi:hypothetical protein
MIYIIVFALIILIVIAIQMLYTALQNQSFICGQLEFIRSSLISVQLQTQKKEDEN